MICSVIGLGKLGASMAAAIASQGIEVIGVDISQQSVDRVNEGLAPVQETNLAEMIAANKDRIRATMSHEEAILNSDVSFVVVPTPSNSEGAFSLQYASWAFQKLGQALAKKDGYHNIVLTSTVLPGATRWGLLPILEKESGKQCGPDFGLCYSPEFIALGSIIQDFLNPDFLLLGEFDDRCGAQLEELYSRVVTNNAPCKRMSLENAELTKIAVNTFVTTKITFANMVSEICEQIPGGDVDVVTEALGSDSRIGKRYLKGGLGYGGPCFPRDNVALSYMARQLGLEASIAETTDHVNRNLVHAIIQKLEGRIDKGTTVAVLGLSYKPYSHVIEESQGVMLARALADHGARVVAYDPLAREMARGELKDKVMIVDQLSDCLEQATVLLVATPDPEFAALTLEQVRGGRDNTIVVDFWRLLSDVLDGQAGIDYIAGGRGEHSESNQDRLRKLWEPTEYAN